MLYVLFALIAIWYFAGTRAKKKEEIPNPIRKGYDLRTFQAPRVSGGGLRIAATILEIPVISHAIIWLLFRRNKFHTLRNLKFSCHPTFYPLVHDFRYDDKIDGNYTLSAEKFFELEGERITQKEKTGGIAQILDYARAYAIDLLPSDVAKQVIKSIKESDNREIPVRYVIHMNEKDVLQQAQLSDARIRAGNPISILDGVPILVKDEFDAKGLPTSCGTAFHTEIAKEDSTIAEKLREKGAIVIGKSNMVEIGISAKGVNPHYGTARNPFNLRHHTGGSSAGSAGAVASGLVPLATAADIGGSIRIPAALCGAVGLKPTFGRVSHHGSFPLSWTLGHAGPITTSVRDCAIGYATFAGEDPRDANTKPQPHVVLPNFNLISVPSPLLGLRIGVYSPWVEHAAPEIVKSFHESKATLASLGAEIVEVTILDGIFEFCRLAHTMVILSEMRASVQSHLDCGVTRRKFGLDTRLTLSVSKLLTATDYMQASCLRTLAIQSFKEVFSKIDLLITPATATPAPRINTPDGKEEIDVRMEALLMRYVFIGNFVGIPALTMPCGYTPEGLPIGLQFLGRWWEEHVVLKAAYALESHISKQNPVISFTNLPVYD